mmetsp:Transcript_4871/g.18269  ORF Transcript_4871/g.18269 Transcript_4871/m.18269 type:complete len:929 (-) Transcript_4871:28-2814(-)
MLLHLASESVIAQGFKFALSPQTMTSTLQSRHHLTNIKTSTPNPDNDQERTVVYHQNAFLPTSPVLPVKKNHTNPILTKHNLEEHDRMELLPVIDDSPDQEEVLGKKVEHKRVPVHGGTEPHITHVEETRITTPTTVSSTESYAPAAFQFSPRFEPQTQTKTTKELSSEKPYSHVVERIHVPASDPTYHRLQVGEEYVPRRTRVDDRMVNERIIREPLEEPTIRQAPAVPLERIVRNPFTNEEMVQEPSIVKDILEQQPPSTISYNTRLSGGSVHGQYAVREIVKIDDGLARNKQESLVEENVVSRPITENQFRGPTEEHIIREKRIPATIEKRITRPSQELNRTVHDSLGEHATVERFLKRPSSISSVESFEEAAGREPAVMTIGTRPYGAAPQFVDVVPMGDYMRTPTSEVSIGAVSPSLFDVVTTTSYTKMKVHKVPKLYALHDRAILQILSHLSHREILQARLIHRVFDRFITDERTQKDLCLADHLVLNINVFEKDIQPSAPLFAVLCRLFPHLLPYGTLSEHYLDDAQSSTSREIERDAYRISLKSQVYDHEPSIDEPFQLIILKKKRDLLQETHDMVRSNAANALVLNASGLSEGTLRTFFDDPTHTINIIQLPKFKETSRAKTYETLLSEPCLRDGLRRALRVCVRRTIHSRDTVLMPFKDLVIVEHKSLNKTTGLYQVEQKKVEKRGFVPVIPKTLIPIPRRRRTSLPRYVVQDTKQRKTNYRKRRRFKRFMSRHFHRFFGKRHYKYKHKKHKTIVVEEEVIEEPQETNIVEEVVNERPVVETPLVEEVTGSPVTKVVERQVHKPYTDGEKVEEDVREMTRPRAATKIVKERIVEHPKVKVTEKEVEQENVSPQRMVRRSYGIEHENGVDDLEEDLLLETSTGRVLPPPKVSHKRVLGAPCEEEITPIESGRSHLRIPF